MNIFKVECVTEKKSWNRFFPSYEVAYEYSVKTCKNYSTMASIFLATLDANGQEKGAQYIGDVIPKTWKRGFKTLAKV